MKIWLVRDLEPTQIDDGQPRLLRAGMLSDALAKRGHDTTWFTSSFNHYSRKHRPVGCFQPKPNLTLQILKGIGYRKNLGVGRIFHNYHFGRGFRRAALSALDIPDLILADLPTTEAAAAAVEVARKFDIPVVLTIRDLWPDFFAEFTPPLLSPIVKLALRPLDTQARLACRHATSLVGISQSYMDWGRVKGGRDSSLDRIFYLGYPRPKLPFGLKPDDVMSNCDAFGATHVVSFVGSWGATYDLSIVVEAASLLRDRKDIVFAVAGDYSARPELKEAFERLSNVRLLGWLDKHEVSSLLARSSIGLLPYSKKAPQGLPNKIFEYMAYGLFQVATLSSEAKDLLESTNTGIQVPAGSGIDLANAIKLAISKEVSEEKRWARQAVFEDRFEASQLYDAFIDHVEYVAALFQRGIIHKSL